MSFVHPRLIFRLVTLAMTVEIADQLVASVLQLALVPGVVLLDQNDFIFSISFDNFNFFVNRNFLGYPNSTGQALPDDAVFKDLIVIVCCNIEAARFIVFRQLRAHEHLNTLRFPPISAFKQQLLVQLLLCRGCSHF